MESSFIHHWIELGRLPQEMFGSKTGELELEKIIIEGETTWK
jgi:hypothetical protein